MNNKEFGQLVDFSQLKKKPEEPKVEVQPVTDEMINNNPILKRAIELQKIDDSKLDSVINIIMSTINIFLDNTKLKEDEALRTEYITRFASEIEALCLCDNTINRDVKYGYMALAKTMNLLGKLFYGDPVEYQQDLRNGYEICVKDGITNILDKNPSITTRQFYTIPGSMIEYIAWNDNLDKASSETQLTPPIPSDSQPEEIPTVEAELIEQPVTPIAFSGYTNIQEVEVKPIEETPVIK